MLFAACWREGRMITSVIFDIDGTLVDSVDLHAKAWQEAFAHFGYRLDYAEVRRQIGKCSDKLIPHFLSPEEYEELGEQLDDYRNQLYKREYLPKVRAFPRVRELFERIRADGKRIALASSAKGDELATYKRKANIADLVDEQTSSDDAEHSKPSPDIIEAALRCLGDTPAEEAIMIGDTPYAAAAKIGKASDFCVAVGARANCARQDASRHIVTPPIFWKSMSNRCSDHHGKKKRLELAQAAFRFGSCPAILSVADQIGAAVRA